MATDFYELDTFSHHWGEHYDILTHGYIQGCNTQGLVKLNRTGPIISPISFPKPCIVVTNMVKQVLESSHLKGIAFKEVIKSKIVDLPWHSWDPHADHPELYPEDKQAENYIKLRPNNDAMSNELGELWRLDLCEGIETQCISNPKTSQPEYHIIPESWNGSDLFIGKDTGITYATEAGASFLEDYSNSIFEFKQPRILKSAPR